MATINEFILPFKGLLNGVHKYSFDINSNFFTHFEMSKIKVASLQLLLSFDKRDNLMTLDFSCTGNFQAICDRCLSDVRIPLEWDERIYVKYGESEETDETVIYLESGSIHLDLTDTVYELIHVHLPITNIIDCKKEQYAQCDQVTLKKMQELEVQEEKEVHRDNELWKELKNIKFTK